jgi:hypothetical protein
MSLSLLLRGASGPETVYVNGELVPLPERTRRLMEGISPLIQSQVPDFVNFDHPNFVAFLEAYYEWMENEGNATERTLLLNDYTDIERTLDQFVESFEDRFMKNIPRVFDTDSAGNVVDRKNILKNAKDFYAVKGTEKSFEFFFHAFFNSIVEFYYPRVDMIETSGGNWIEKKSIRVTSANANDVFSMKGKTITQKSVSGVDTDATATVVDVIQYEVFPYKVSELFLDNIQGNFFGGRKVECEISSGNRITETIFGLVGEFELTNAGSGYRINDNIVILDNKTGVGAAAKVIRVDNLGRIKQITILDHGTNYAENIEFSVESETGEGALGVGRSSAIAVYDGFFFDDGGKPSSRKRLQDGDYYQRFSYVLKTNLSLQKYEKALKALIHPAGFKVFGDVLLAKDLTSNMPFHSQARAEELSIIGNYTPYTFGTTQDLRSNNSTSGTSVDLYPNGFAPGYTGVGSNGSVIGTVPEAGITAHVVGTGLTGPLGTAGAEGFTAAQSLDLNFFPVYHHPNVRGLNIIPSGTSFGGITLDPFFFIPVGEHFHSNPTYSTWTSPQFPYLGSTADGGTHDEYYSVPYGTTSESPNP